MTQTALQTQAQVEVDYDPFAGGELLRVVPTTEPQREVWLAARLGDDASLAFNESVALRLRGKLDGRALQKALDDVVARHDALRASFGPDGETFCVAALGPCDLIRTDLTSLSPTEREARVQAVKRKGVDTVFSLEQGHLFRAELLILAADEHLLVMNAHHIVCDGWSWWVIVRELGERYREHLGDSVAENTSAESYADYALAEALHPGGIEHRADERYWLSRFTGEVPVLDLPTDRPRPPRRCFASRREDYVLDAALVTAIRRMGARRGASLFATLLGGFAGLLARVSGQSDVVIGIPAAGQSVDGHDDLVGHCVNLLPLRFNMDPALPFTATLDAAQETLLDALEHQRYTFGTLLKNLHIERDPSRLPLVSVMFNIDQALDHEKAGFPGLALEFTTNPRTHENFELSINAVQVQGELRLECQYHTDIFDPDTIRRWLGNYEALLRAATEDAEQSFARLNLLDAHAVDELQALQPAPVAYDRQCLMHEHFERQCDRDPQRIALRCGTETLSYAALELRSNRIAHWLRDAGVHRGGLVGLAVDRGPDMLAGLLGILKAGAGYVPLDPQFPADRLAYMAGDAGLAALVTQSRHAGQFDLRGRPVLAVDATEALAKATSARLKRSELDAQPESAAYVIYTSGSTGRPKGVQVPHRAVANFLESMAREPGLGPQDRLLAVTTLSFDIAVLELLLPLSVGAQVVLADKDSVIDGLALKQLLSESGATVMQATPATWRMLIEAGWTAGAPGFRALCGGEPLPPDLATQLLARCGELWNLYGPTETTVWSTCMRVLATAGGQGPDIHIGRPIANTQVWILDEQGNLCPRGVPGEICIGGDGVTLGYLDRAELTAEKFLPDSFVTGIHAIAPKLYRTGDRGRWRGDGNLEHMGRLDFQVKVRGYRIELGEIENNLVAYPGVARAVAMAREDRPGDVRLVAYLVVQGASVIDEAAVLGHLRGALPDYMIPQHLVMLDAIPLLPNGKIDRKGLPPPASLAPLDTAARVAPRDALETTVAAAMEAVLGRPGIGVDDGFFALGGHSLLAAQLCARLTRELGVQVTLRTLFEAPTVARLANALRGSLAKPDTRDLQARIVPRRADQRRAPMTLMQQRLWFFEQLEPGSVTYNTPSAHRLHGPMDLPAFERAFQEMMRRQPILRTVLVAGEEEVEQQVREQVEFSLLPVTDLSALPESEREAALMGELEALTAQPFMLENSLLFRARLYRLGDEDHVLYFMTHHLIWDGWSFDVFYSEMSALYGAYSQGQESPLPELEVSYGDFAQWHAQWLAGPELQQQVGFWAEHLKGGIEPLHLPEDRPRPARASGQGGTQWVQVDRSTADRLREIGNQAGATLFMTLLAAYYVLLHRLSGQSDLVVGLPVRNRNSEALEKIMGFFVNVLPLRMKLDPGTPFIAVVEQVRQAVIEAFAYPDVPLEHLVRELHVPRDTSRSPLYQALFSFQDVRARKTRWGGLEHEHLLMFQKGMSNDLGLWFLEHEHGLSGAMGYNTDILSDASAELINHRLVSLLKSFSRNPQVAIGDADVLCAQDLEQLTRWNATAVDLPAETTLHALLKAQVERTPQRSALTFNGASLTYRQLDERAEYIAAALHGRGVRPGDLVGIMLERNTDLVAAMIAVLKAGAAYVPLDPAYPVDRLRFMAEDAQLALVVSTGGVADGLSWPREGLLLLDADSAEVRQAESARTVMAADISPASPAYVIYTSGSTGKPKGVAVPHGAVVNFLASMQREPGLNAEDRLLAVTTTSFDIAVLELFLPLITGAQVVIASRDTAIDGVALAALIKAGGITVMQATPSSWRLLLEAGWPGGKGFKALCGGEPLPLDLAGQLLGAGVELWNMYGPTETTVWSSCWRVDDLRAGPSIGTPIANTTIWVLDPRGNRCPPGVSGEIYIGGLGVALGYLHRPELTAERFIADHLVPGSGGRLYRTGDRGRWRLDGRLEHQGRLDFQVKVRGHRIELGEIESRLTAIDGVANAVVIVREDRPGDVRLVAYVVRRTGASLVDSALIETLAQELPSYMLPQHVVMLDALPLLPNGKIDRKALPEPAARADSPRVDALARPRDALEMSIATIMADVLKLDEVGIDEDFFAIGGHSMLAVRMFHRINRETGINLPLATLFMAPTVRGLAEAYKKSGAVIKASRQPTAAAHDPWALLVPMRKGEGRFPLFLIHAVGGNVLNYRVLAEAMPAGVPVYGLQAVGLDGKTAPLKHIEDMASRYVAEIRKVQPSGPYYIAGGSMGGVIAYEIAQQLSSQGQRVALLGLFDTYAQIAAQDQAGAEADGIGGKWIHLRNLLGKEQTTGGRARTLARWVAYGMGSRAVRLYASLARKLKIELPHSMRYAYVEQVHVHAYRRYVAKPYAGSLRLFRAEQQPDRRPALGWEELVDDIRIVHIPGDHTMVVEAPELATGLAAAIEETTDSAQVRSNRPAGPGTSPATATAGGERPRLQLLMAALTYPWYLF